MSYIAPDTDIYLLANVECDKSYDNVKYFATKNAQHTYMSSKIVKSFTNQSYGRVNKGTFRLFCKADDVYQCNYLMFQNTAFGNKWFYAFINSIEYVSNNTCEVRFTIDLFQTWFLDCTVGQCFVEREHVTDDSIGAHTLNEDVPTGEMITAIEEQLTEFSKQYTYGVEICISDTQLSGIANQPTWFDKPVLSGIFQGSKIGTTDNSDDLLTFLNNVILAGYQSTIIQVFTIPKIFAPSGTDSRVQTTRELPALPTKFGNYTPLNNRLYSSPFSDYVVYAPTGDKMVLHPELFSDYEHRILTFSGNQSVTPQVMCVPTNYKITGGTNKTEGYTLNYGIKGSFMYDAYQAEIASYGVGQVGGTLLKWSPRILGSVASAFAGISQLATGSMTGLTFDFAPTQNNISPAGGASAIAGVSGIIGTVGDALKETHDTSELSGASGGSVLWSQQILDTFVQVRQVREEYARIADNYFSMFGYKVCRLKVPNIATRPSWNFVKCSTVAITGAIPADAEELIMSVLKKGVTFWKTTFGNYTANNK